MLNFDLSMCVPVETQTPFVPKLLSLWPPAGHKRSSDASLVTDCADTAEVSTAFLPQILRGCLSTIALWLEYMSSFIEGHGAWPLQKNLKDSHMTAAMLVLLPSG